MSRRTKDTWTDTMCMGRVSQASRKKNSCITNLLGAFGKFNQCEDIHKPVDEINLDLCKVF